MKAIKWSIIGLLVFTLVFNFMPTGNSASDVVTGFQSMRSYGTAQTTMAQDLISELTGDPEKDQELYNTIGEAIAAYGVYLCTTYGSGDRVNQRNTDTEHAIQYCGVGTSKCGLCGNGTVDYNSSGSQFDNMLRDVINGKRQCVHGSCAAFGTYCWWKYLGTAAPFTAGSTTLGVSVFDQNGLLQGDGTPEFIVENGKPGDLLVFEAENKADGRFEHTELYIGPISVNIDGTEFDYKAAVVGMNWSDADCTIKEVTRDDRAVYLCSLAKYLEFNGIRESELKPVAPDDAVSVDGAVNNGGA